MMNKLLLLLVLLLFCCCTNEDSSAVPKLNHIIEGKWVSPNNTLNTMYIFEQGIRYTFYCSEDDCDSQYQSFQAADGNHLPTINPYTVENNILTVDLHFGNELITPLKFECEGNKVIFEASSFELIRLESDCN